MEENKMMEETTTDMVPEETSEGSGMPIQLIVAAGSFVLGGIYLVGKKVFGRKKYAEVDRPIRLVKDK